MAFSTATAANGRSQRSGEFPLARYCEISNDCGPPGVNHVCLPPHPDPGELRKLGVTVMAGMALPAPTWSLYSGLRAAGADFRLRDGRPAHARRHPGHRRGEWRWPAVASWDVCLAVERRSVPLRARRNAEREHREAP